MLRAPVLSAVFVLLAPPVALAQVALSHTIGGIATDEECEPWGSFRFGENHIVRIPITPPSASGAMIVASRPSDAVPAGPDGAPDGSNGPAGHGNGSVTIEGEFTFTLPIAEAPQNAAEPLSLAFLYRSEGCGSAMPGFHDDWHFNAVDEVTINLGPGGEEDPQVLNWLNGLGNKYDFLTPVEVQGPAGSETWWNEFGSPFSRFRLYWPAGIPTLERYTARGSVTRYEKRYVSATQTIWRPRYHWDLHDNKTTLNWQTDGKLASIQDPRGVVMSFTWTANACSVTYTKGNTSFFELDWSFSFDGSERITEYRLPANSYVSSLTGTLYDLGLQPYDQRGFAFTYDPGNANVVTVQDFRGTPSTAAIVVSNTYQRLPAGTGPWRVTQQQDFHGATHTIDYTLNGATLTQVEYTSPRLTEYAYAVDVYKRPTSLTVTPSSQFGGKPRATDGDEPEPTNLTYQFFYQAGCPCPLLSKIVYPSGMTFEYTWDLEIARLTSMKVPRPSGQMGTVTYTWSYHDFEHFGQPISYTPPAGGASLTFNYTPPSLPGWSTRADGLWGYKYQSYTATTSVITQHDGSQQTISTTIEVLADGRTNRVTVPAGNGTSSTYQFLYETTGPKERLLKEIQRLLTNRSVRYVFDEIGRIESLSTGDVGDTLTLDFETDAIGRVTRTSMVPAAGQAAYVQEVYRDRFDNLVISRRSNTDPSGQAPKYANGSGNGRPWVHFERHYAYDRQTAVFVDRRPLPDASNVANPTTGPNPWMVDYLFGYHPDGTLDAVTLPNGKLLDFQIDGYGTLYKAVMDSGGLNVESPRYFFDTDLVIAKVKRKLEGSAFATTTFARNFTGYLFKMTDPTGVIREASLDDLGRTWQQELKSGGPVRLRSTLDYDELGRVKIAHRHLLDPSGNTITTTATKLLYNELSQVLTIEGDLGRKVFRTYDQAGRLKTVRDNLGATSAQSNEVELFYQSGRDVVSQVTSKIFEDVDTPGQKQYVTTYERDLLGRVTKVLNKGLNGTATPITREYAYDSLGNIVGGTDPLGFDTVGAFDAVGRWVEIVERGDAQHPEIRLTSEYKDELAQPEMVRRDGSQFATRHVMDTAYRLSQIFRPGHTTGDAHSQAYTYDPGSRIKTIRDGNGSVATQTFDAASRLLSRQVTPGNGVSTLAVAELFERDDIGRLVKMTTFQAGGVLMGSVEFPQDSLGRLLHEKFQYFGVDPSESTIIASGYDTGSALGDPSFRRSLTYSNQLQLGFEPDDVARPESFEILGGPAGITSGTLATYRFSGSQVNRRTTNYLGSTNSQTTDFGFDDYRRLISIEDKLNGTPFSRFDFEWDAAGNLLKEKYTTAGGRLGDRFKYDPFDRLEAAKLGVASMAGDFDSVQISAKEITYALDPGNSRSSVTQKLEGQSPTTTPYQVQSNSPRYAQVGGTTLQYDGEGNMTFDGQYYLVYDFKNRLSEVYFGYVAEASGARSSLSSNTPIRKLREARAQILRKLNGRLETAVRDPKRAQEEGWLNGESTAESGEDPVGLDLIAAYGYDPMNRRILRMVTTGGFKNHRYAYDGWNEVEELGLVFEGVWKAKAQKAFVWGARPDELVAYHRLEGATWKPYYAATARHGSIVRLRRADGVEVEKVEYDPYGKAFVFPLNVTIPWLKSSVENPYLYAAKRLDDETGFLYSRNRYVHTGYGRFLTMDPLGSWADRSSSGNGYVLAGNAPTVRSDPMGLLSVVDGGYSGGGWPGPADAMSPPGFGPAMAGAGGGGGGGCAGSGMVVDLPDGAPEFQDPARRPGGGASSPILDFTVRTVPMPPPVRPVLDGSQAQTEWLGQLELGSPRNAGEQSASGGSLGDVLAGVAGAIGAYIAGELTGGLSDLATTVASGSWWWLPLDLAGLVPGFPGSGAAKVLCKCADDVGGAGRGGGRAASQIDRSAFRAEREAFWKAEAQGNPGEYTAENLERMRGGRAPVGADGKPMELHHVDGSPGGGLTPMTQTDHRIGENYLKNHPWLK